MSQGRNVHGPHRFAATTHCRINNGLLRLTVGPAGVAPSLTVEAWRPAVTVGDVYVDVYADLYGGSLSTPAWVAVGTLTIDSSVVVTVGDVYVDVYADLYGGSQPTLAPLTAVQLHHISPEALTIRLVAPLMADAFVTLRRGERHVRIQHGSTRAPLVSTTRRVRLTASPSPVGTASLARVEEASPAIDGFPRYIGALDPVTADAAAFSLVTDFVTTARFGAGVGTAAQRDRPIDMHKQLADASRPVLVVT